MGYESKIIIAEKTDLDGKYFYSKIADVKMSKCDGEFLQIFNDYGKDIENEIYMDDTYTQTDKYGDILREVNIEVLKDGLNKIIATKESYRRYNVLKGLLDAFNPYEWSENIVCIHYGY